MKALMQLLEAISDVWWVHFSMVRRGWQLVKAFEAMLDSPEYTIDLHPESLLSQARPLSHALLGTQALNWRNLAHVVVSVDDVLKSTMAVERDATRLRNLQSGWEGNQVLQTLSLNNLWTCVDSLDATIAQRDA